MRGRRRGGGGGEEGDGGGSRGGRHLGRDGRHFLGSQRLEAGNVPGKVLVDGGRTSARRLVGLQTDLLRHPLGLVGQGHGVAVSEKHGEFDKKKFRLVIHHLEKKAWLSIIFEKKAWLSIILKQTMRKSLRRTGQKKKKNHWKNLDLETVQTNIFMSQRPVSIQISD